MLSLTETRREQCRGGFRRQIDGITDNLSTKPTLFVEGVEKKTLRLLTKRIKPKKSKIYKEEVFSF